MFNFKVGDDTDTYWLGFIIADGCLCSRDKNRFRFHLKYDDKCHLELFNEFLRSKEHKEGTIYSRLNKKHPSVEFSCYSEPLKLALNAWGIYPKKTSNFELNPKLVYEASFWRGMMDGDGHWAKYERGIQASLATSNPSIATGFINFCDNLDVETVSHWNRGSINIRRAKGVRLLASTLYPKADTYALARKRDRALSL